MANEIKGLHHITAIASNAQVNYDFYTKVLGLRLVKKTVNFDDPGTYHFYFGNEVGEPGGILTFFPWQGVRRGTNGTGMATEIGYSVNANSLEFWKDRLTQSKIPFQDIQERFGEQYIKFQDPDGLEISLIGSKTPDDRAPWTTSEITKNEGLKGFHTVNLSLQKLEPTAEVLTDLLGYDLIGQEGNKYRFETKAFPTANLVDITVLPDGARGINSAGTNHHVAFRVENEAAQMELREKILSKGLNITPQIDRDYFYSLYFREPGGVLFEIATENPGFTVDEPLESLGKDLKLPKQYENVRKDIENVLPSLIQ
ncbi:ring-cleaving dioxygenase [Rhizosphaericola mali]|uniref:Ring-cleaving dioxygenase n=1 Tax=Rhizosphaericola mali TaxID=2545455 RepID=A0A5P2G6N3_9BACT|nr:ring-cleaving dioxygenase [Rhizosphaericola mali]QES89450.1 ring-cleaving dioxygenase [Rhizosphaericola mali]